MFVISLFKDSYFVSVKNDDNDKRSRRFCFSAGGEHRRRQKGKRGKRERHKKEQN